MKNCTPAHIPLPPITAIPSDYCSLSALLYVSTHMHVACYLGVVAVYLRQHQTHTIAAASAQTVPILRLRHLSSFRNRDLSDERTEQSLTDDRTTNPHELLRTMFTFLLLTTCEPMMPRPASHSRLRFFSLLLASAFCTHTLTLEWLSTANDGDGVGEHRSQRQL